MSVTFTGRRTAAALLTAALLVPLAACGSDEKDSGDRATASSGAPKADLTVLAASSLTDVFRTAGAAYEKEHPGTKVTFSFGGSQELAAQVQQGAPRTPWSPRTPGRWTASGPTPERPPSSRRTVW